MGRAKDLIIRGGHNIYPAHIEEYAHRHPRVRKAAAFAVPDERLGEVGRAYVVLRPGTSSSPEELLAWSRENMANYKVPRSFAVVDDLPRNAAGKVMKTELRGPE